MSITEQKNDTTMIFFLLGSVAIYNAVLSIAFSMNYKHGHLVVNDTGLEYFPMPFKRIVLKWSDIEKINYVRDGLNNWYLVIGIRENKLSDYFQQTGVLYALWLDRFFVVKAFITQFPHAGSQLMSRSITEYFWSVPLSYLSKPDNWNESLNVVLNYYAPRKNVQFEEMKIKSQGSMVVDIGSIWMPLGLFLLAIIIFIF
ncbi:MAG TPA: hypothetical protein PKL83_04385 [bacterium]|nr:hypothetical protein [bacterium]